MTDTIKIISPQCSDLNNQLGKIIKQFAEPDLDAPGLLVELENGKGMVAVNFLDGKTKVCYAGVNWDAEIQYIDEAEPQTIEVITPVVIEVSEENLNTEGIA